MASENTDHNNVEANRVADPRIERRRYNLEVTLENFFNSVSGHPTRARDREINFVQVMTDLMREGIVTDFEMETFENVFHQIMGRWLMLEWNRRSPTPTPEPESPSEIDTSSDDELVMQLEINLDRTPRTPSAYDTSEDEFASPDGLHEI